MARKLKKKIPESQKRWNAKHCTVSAKMTQNERDKLMKYLKALLVLTGDLEIKTKSALEASSEGYNKGLNEAKARYAVTYECARGCGRSLTIHTTEEKQAAGALMTAEGWGHSECPT